MLHLLGCSADPSLPEQELSKQSEIWRERYNERVANLLEIEELRALEKREDSVEQDEVVETIPASTNHRPIPSLVEMLFDLLPALRAANRARCVGQGDGSLSYNERYFANANGQLNDADEILKKVDEAAKEKEGPAYTLRLRQERECLERVHLDCKSGRDIDGEVLKEIQWEQIELDMNLCEHRSLSHRWSVWG